ncbi:ATP-dependent DNA helicase pif1, partial [Brachionus plicatilis]
MLNDGSAEQLLRRMTPYSANITGSNAYWFQRRSELESTFEQKKPATVFFTFSYADNYWEDLHRLLPGGFSTDPKKRYFNVLNNPHLVDWYFGIRLNEFLKIVFGGILDCEWRWHRYEWQSRSSIHAHSAAHFKNDPGLNELTKKVYVGRLANTELEKGGFTPTRLNELIQLVKDGIDIEKKLIIYAETLLSAINPRVYESHASLSEPHPCSIDFTTLNEDEYDKDYEDLVNCVQIHNCRPNGYCKSKKMGKECRFEFPFSILEKSEIV